MEAVAPMRSRRRKNLKPCGFSAFPRSSVAIAPPMLDHPQF